MKPLHGITDKRLLNSGANFDQHEKFVALSQKGEYIDAHNFRHPMDGNGDALEKIGGETITFPAVDNACPTNTGAALADTYVCLGDAHFFEQANNQDRQIEFWADSNNVLPALIRIDGIIVCRTTDLPLTYPNFLQLDVNQNCVGGEIYITDNIVPPMIFNLTDLMVNGNMIADASGDFQCTQKYFDNFDLSLYQVELATNNNHPIFIQLSLSQPQGSIKIGAGGLKVGQYQYQIRSSTEEGDRTGWCVATPLIPVPVRIRTESTQYPATKTFGADPQVISQLGVHLRYRIDNRGNYDFLEIKRTRFTIGAALDVPAEEKILNFRIDLSPNEIRVIDLFDTADESYELPVTDDDIDSNFAVIDRAKGVRYYNQRLHFMNVRYKSRDVQADFLETASGNKAFPVVDDIGKIGHKDPYLHTYYRSFMNGEKYGFGVVFRDANNQRSFTQKMGTDAAGNDFNNYQIPNRRKQANTDTTTYSSPITTANTDGLITPTHEIFDNDSSEGKPSFLTDFSPFRRDGLFPSLPAFPYNIWNPVGQRDSDVNDHPVRPNSVVTVNSMGSGIFAAYNPFGFGMNYKTVGIGVTGVDNIPSHIKSFSVVRTRAAERVFAQGIGFYDINNPNFHSIKKEKKTIWFYSPDLDPATGVKDMDIVIDSIAAGSGRFKLQLVSPLGFFSEIYSAHTPVGAVSPNDLVSDAVDMIVYARILKERGQIGNTNSFNPTDFPDAAVNGFNGVGISDGTYGHIAYGKWRKRGVAGGTFFNSANGEHLFDINAIVRESQTLSNVHAEHFAIEVTDNIYEYDNMDAFNSNTNFNDVDMQNWHEPIYIINIIDTQAETESANIVNYQETGHYQKTEAVLGLTAGTPESFLLVDERFEDCFQSGTEDKVVFIQTPSGVEEVWQDLTNFTAAQQAVIFANIAAGTQTVIINGDVLQVNGGYTRTSVVETVNYARHSVVFSNTAPFFLPATASKVIVRYNQADPLKVFNGDVTHHEAIFAPVDIAWDSSADTNFSLYLPCAFPYISYNMYSKRPRGTVNFFYENSDAWLTTSIERGTRLRQIICMFTCQSRINLPFEFELEEQNNFSLLKYFPATHYIMRPFFWDNSQPSPLSTNNNFDPQYEIDYPKEGESGWGYGGFRFKPQTNLDYGKTDINHNSTSKPAVGFTEETEFCTRDIWSVIRPINAIDSPGVRSFPALNFFDISDDTGEIKYAYDDDVQDRGNNLYAITDSGICLLITDKTLLFDKTGNELAAIGSSDSAVVRDQIWLSKTVGMSDEMWRGAAEGFTVLEGNVRKQTLFFFNKDSVYKLVQGQIVDIAREANYHRRVFPTIAQLGKKFTDNVTGVYDLLHDSYWLQIKLVNSTEPEVFCYEEKKQKFVGHFSYGFDKYLSFHNKTFGMRKATTYLLNQGLQINGANIEAWLTGATTNKLDPSEYYYIKVDSNNQPHRIEFYNDKDQYIAGQVQALIDTDINPLALKQYYGFSNYVPRKFIPPDFHRLEGEVMVFRVRHNRAQPLVIVSIECQSKLLK